MRPSILDRLLSPVSILRGVGPKLEKIINRLGIFLNVHLIWHFPYNFIQRKFYEDINLAPLNTLVSIKVKILKHYPSKFKRQPYKVTSISGNSEVDIVFFNARHPVVRSMLPVNTTKLISGKLEFFRNKFQITHPTNIADVSEYQTVDEKEAVYGLTAGLNQKTISKITNQIINNLPEFKEWINKSIIKKYDFYEWKKSVIGLHDPSTTTLQNNYRRRLAFDELLAHQLAISIIRNINIRKKSINFKTKNHLTKKFINSLKFKLTNSQLKVLEEIKNDLFSPNQMIRLLQGDVGSGKTIVALISMIIVVEKKYQSVLMVPTSILAYQHYENIKNLLKEFPINIEILVGKDKGKEKLLKLEKIKNGSADIIIGTHALIQEGVLFNKLGIAVIDEQHKFGVYQRMAFNYKNQNPSILVMSATPIPRTLTLAAYGDMDESRITEKPIGRRLIKTTALKFNKEKDLIERIKLKIKNTNSKFFWVCPLIEESEELDLKAATERYNSLNNIFKHKVLLIHGQLAEKEKEKIMNKFENEDFRILVSTTVIEVGIDIKSATTIIIEHAERFGLAQMHQLRGRVGRNNFDSYCILFHKNQINDIAKKRIKIMIETNNGFKIAEEDLKIRGPGEILGKKQSGLPTFNVADLSFDSDLFEDAKFLANEIISKNPKLIGNDGDQLKILLYLQERDAAIKTLMAG